MRPGYLQKNGVPYSGTAIVTEYFHRADEENGDSLLIVTTIVDDPQYLRASLSAARISRDFRMLRAGIHNPVRFARF